MFRTARFDVFREKAKKYLQAEVIETDFESDAKRVHFHYLRLKKQLDEWIEVGSSRIAPLNSFTSASVKEKHAASIAAKRNPEAKTKTKVESASDPDKRQQEEQVHSSS